MFSIPLFVIAPSFRKNQMSFSCWMDQQTADPGWNISQQWKVHSAGPYSNTADSPVKDAEWQKPLSDVPAHMMTWMMF